MYCCFRVLKCLFLQIISGIALLSVSMAAAADTSTEEFKLPNDVRFDIEGTAGNIELKNVAASNAKWYYASWRGDKASTHINVIATTVFNKWMNISVTFTPSRSGKVKIALMGKYLPVKDSREFRRVPAIWDNVTVDGAKIINGDFEEIAGTLPKGWTAEGRKADEVKMVADAGQVQSGKNAVRVWYEAALAQMIDVQENKPVTVSAWVMQLNGESNSVLNLAGVANMALKDEVAGDKKGGWTDQGKGNDLSALTPGDAVYANVRFNIASSPNAAIVLRNSDHAFLPETALVPVPDSLAESRYVYLLHATAMTAAATGQIGRIVPVFNDGDGVPVSVERGRDVNDWWAPNHLPNGYVGWSAANQSSYVGLYVSRFELPAGKKLSALRFESAGKALWGIVGVSLSAKPVELPKSQGWTVAASQEWIPFSLEKEIEAGTALDFSGLLDAPAGKNGFVKIQGEHFVFEKNGQRARFAGVNFSIMSPKVLGDASAKDLARLADRLARMGINLVRISHVDAVIRRETAQGPDIDPVQMDKFDLFLAELKKRGIYFTMDLFMGRWYQNVTDKFYPGFRNKGNSRHAYEASFPLMSEFREDLKLWSHVVLSHVNPYTGLALKDDPVLLYLGLLNEDYLPLMISTSPEQVAVLYSKSFSLWLKKRYGNTAALKKEWGVDLLSVESIELENVKLNTKFTSGKRDSDSLQFVTEIHAAAYREMAEFLKKIGVNTPLVDLNMMANRYTALVRKDFQMVESHCYWDHPRFVVKDWSLPYGHHQRSILRKDQWWNRDNYFIDVASARQNGKPFVVGEYDHVFPNNYRCEAGLFWGSLSALQDWDAIINFTYGSEPESFTSDFPAKSFDKVNEAIGQATERQVKFLFLRSDAKPAAGQIDLWSPAQKLSDTDFLTGGEATILAFVTKTGLNLNETPSGNFPVLPLLPGINAGKMQLELSKSGSQDDLSAWFNKVRKGIVTEGNRSNISAGVIETETGEALFEFKNGRIIVNTPKSRGAVVQRKDKIDVPGLSMDIDAGVASLSFHSLDGLPLEQSRHILAIFPTDVLNAGMRFENANTLVAAWGSPKKLLRQGRAQIVLNNNNLLKVWALSTSGRRIEQINAVSENGQIKTLLAHKLTNGSAIYWEFAEK